jgi:hypothetical protein
MIALVLLFSHKALARHCTNINSTFGNLLATSASIAGWIVLRELFAIAWLWVLTISDKLCALNVASEQITQHAKSAAAKTLILFTPCTG